MSRQLRKIRPGDLITADFLNGPLDILNDAARKPQSDGTNTPSDDDGDNTPGDVHYTVQSAQTETVRIEDPDDANTYIDVDRVTFIVLQESSTGATLSIDFSGLYEA